MFWACNPTPIDREIPTIKAFCWLKPSCKTVRTPSTKSIPITIIRMEPVTGRGIVRRVATIFGSKASPISMAPAA